MENLDFTQPSASPVYDPAAAKAFFAASGKVENIEAGKTIFVERQKGGFFTADDRMYFLVEGAVALTLGGKSLDTVKPGEIFGELATITDSKSNDCFQPANQNLGRGLTEAKTRDLRCQINPHCQTGMFDFSGHENPADIFDSADFAARGWDCAVT